LLLAASTAMAPAQSPRKQLPVIGGAKGFQHDSVSFAMARILRPGVDNDR
jgi:hypothetical protein